MYKFKDFINESIIDTKKKTLDNQIWNDKQKLKEKVESYIINKIEKFLKDNGMVKNVIKDLYVVGSITGLYYSKDSDVDINVLLYLSDDRIESLWKKIIDINEKNIPNTKHPLNFYLSKHNADLKVGSSIYSIYQKKWIKQKEEVKIDNIDWNGIITLTTTNANSIDLQIGELKRDLINYIVFNKEIDNIDEIDMSKTFIEKKIKQYEMEIFNDLDVLKITYENIHTFRGKAYTDSEKEKDEYLTKIKTNINNTDYYLNNFNWKLLERFGYIKLLKNINKIQEMLVENKNKLTDAIIKKMSEILNIENKR